MSDSTPLHDYSRSRAVIMGTWEYEFLAPIPAIENSMLRMANMLTGPFCDWPADRLLMLPNQRVPGDLPDQLITAFENVTDVALFYYVGHGQIDTRDQLCLGLTRSRTDWRRRASTSLRFDDVRQALLDCDAATKIVILDCCFAGLANRPSSTLAGLADEVIEMTSGAGAYTMAATSAYTPAWYEDDPGLKSPQTFFTKYLVDLVTQGIPGQPSGLPLDTIFRRLRENLTNDNRPPPQNRVVDSARNFVFAYNAAPLETHRDPELEVVKLSEELARVQAQIAAADAKIEALNAKAAAAEEELARLKRQARSTTGTTGHRLQEAIDAAGRKLDETKAAAADAIADRYEVGYYKHDSPVRVLTAEREALRRAVGRALTSNPKARTLTLFDFGYGAGRVTNEFIDAYVDQYLSHGMDLRVVAYDISSADLIKAKEALCSKGFIPDMHIIWAPEATIGHIAGSITRRKAGVTITVVFVHGNEVQPPEEMRRLALQANHGRKYLLATSWYTNLGYIPSERLRREYFRQLGKLTFRRGEMIMAVSSTGDMVELQPEFSERLANGITDGFPIEAPGDLVYQSKLGNSNFYHVYSTDLNKHMMAITGWSQRWWIEGIRYPDEVFHSRADERANYRRVIKANSAKGDRSWELSDYREFQAVAAFRSPLGPGSGSDRGRQVARSLRP